VQGLGEFQAVRPVAGQVFGQQHAGQVLVLGQRVHRVGRGARHGDDPERLAELEQFGIVLRIVFEQEHLGGEESGIGHGRSYRQHGRGLKASPIFLSFTVPMCRGGAQRRVR